MGCGGLDGHRTEQADHQGEKQALTAADQASLELVGPAELLNAGLLPSSSAGKVPGKNFPNIFW